MVGELTKVLCGEFQRPQVLGTVRHTCLHGTEKEDRQSEKESQIMVAVLRLMRDFKSRGFSSAEVAMNIDVKAPANILGKVLNEMADDGFLIRYLPNAKAKKFLFKFNGGAK